MTASFVNLDGIGECSVCYADCPVLGHEVGRPVQLSHLLCQPCLTEIINRRNKTCPQCASKITSVNGIAVGSHFSIDQVRGFKPATEQIFRRYGFPLERLIQVDIPHLHDEEGRPIQQIGVTDGAPDHWRINLPNLSDQAITTFQDNRGRLGLIFRLATRNQPGEIHTFVYHQRYPNEGQYVVGTPQSVYHISLTEDGEEETLDRRHILKEIDLTSEEVLKHLFDGTHPKVQLVGQMPERLPVQRSSLCTILREIFARFRLV